MKKVILIVVISIMVLTTTFIWIWNSDGFSKGEGIQFILIMILIALALFMGYRRFRSSRRGEPTEDELSKKVMQKAAATSYFISLYLWLVVMYLTDRNKVDSEVMFGWGILGMAMVFVLSWVFYYFRGIKE